MTSLLPPKVTPHESGHVDDHNQLHAQLLVIAVLALTWAVVSL